GFAGVANSIRSPSPMSWTTACARAGVVSAIAASAASKKDRLRFMVFSENSGRRFARSTARCSRSGQVETVEVHDLGPCRDEIPHEFLSGIGAGIDFGQGAELRVRAEDQVDPGAGPFERAGLAVATLIDTAGAGGRLPFGAHVEQVDEE